jgi:LPXTG-motif cell wall-anchored protein
VTSGTDNQQVSVGNGETKQVTFAATAGTSATVSFGVLPAAVTHPAADTTPITVAWEQPAACLTTTAPPAPPALPTTGSRLTPVIASGGGLLVVGAAVLFVLFRRRQATESKTF